MRVTDVGELTDHDTYWHLSYDDCTHVQLFARQGLDDAEAAGGFVRRHYAQCLSCALTNRPVAAETLHVEPDLSIWCSVSTNWPQQSRLCASSTRSSSPSA